jgi:hypothetical protein
VRDKRMDDGVIVELHEPSFGAAKGRQNEPRVTHPFELIFDPRHGWQKIDLILLTLPLLIEINNATRFFGIECCVNSFDHELEGADGRDVIDPNPSRFGPCVHELSLVSQIIRHCFDFDCACACVAASRIDPILTVLCAARPGEVVVSSNSRRLAVLKSDSIGGYTSKHERYLLLHWPMSLMLLFFQKRCSEEHWIGCFWCPRL